MDDDPSSIVGMKSKRLHGGMDNVMTTAEFSSGIDTPPFDE